MNFIKYATALALGLFLQTAHAEGISYNYLQFKYGASSIDDGEIDADGKIYEGSGSFDISDFAFFKVGIGRRSYEVDAIFFGEKWDTETTLELLSLGIGAHQHISENPDFFRII